MHGDFGSPPSFESPTDTDRRPPTAIVVEPALADSFVAIAVLTSLAFHVTVATDFLQARTLVNARRPHLLVTELRLGEYNGLHLVVLARAARDDAAAIVTCRHFDRHVQAEAMSMGATVMHTPTTEREMCAAALRTLLHALGDQVPVMEPFERRHQERRNTGSDHRGGERRRGERRRDSGVIMRTLYPR